MQQKALNSTKPNTYSCPYIDKYLILFQSDISLFLTIALISKQQVVQVMEVIEKFHGLAGPKIDT